MTTHDQTDTLQTVAAILLRCFLLSMGVLLLWFGVYLVAGDLVYGIHSKWFEIGRNDFDLMNYYGMLFVKSAAFLLFLCPWVSIKLVLRKK